MRRAFVLIWLIGLTSCAGSSKFGFVVIELEDSKGPAGLAALSYKSLAIQEFRATITGEGIESPIVGAAGGSADEIRIEGVPYGEDRTILIEALNADGTVLSRRNLEGIDLEPGVVSPIEARLNTIPVALNLRPGSVVLRDNFHVVGFGEPGSSIRITAGSESGSFAFNPSESPNPIVISPSVSTGLFDFSLEPGLFGKQTITLLDESTGESSTVTVYVVNERPGRRLSTAGLLGPTATIGAPLEGRKGESFPALVKHLFNSQNAPSDEESEEGSP